MEGLDSGKAEWVGDGEVILANLAGRSCEKQDYDQIEQDVRVQTIPKNLRHHNNKIETTAKSVTETVQTCLSPPNAVPEDVEASPLLDFFFLYAGDGEQIGTASVVCVEKRSDLSSSLSPPFWMLVSSMFVWCIVVFIALSPSMVSSLMSKQASIVDWEGVTPARTTRSQYSCGGKLFR